MSRNEPRYGGDERMPQGGGRQDQGRQDRQDQKGKAPTATDEMDAMAEVSDEQEGMKNRPTGQQEKKGNQPR